MGRIGAHVVAGRLVVRRLGVQLTDKERKEEEQA